MNGKLKVVGLCCIALFALAGCVGSGTSSSTNGEKSASSPAALKARTDLGLAYMQSGDTVNAKTTVHKVLEIKPDYGFALNALGIIFEAEQTYPLAETYYKKAVAVEPNSAMFHNNYGVFLFERGRYKEACRELSIATQNPFYNRRARAFENLGRCYNKLNQAQRAIQSFERSLSLSGGVQPYSLIELADLYLQQKKYVEAETYYQQFVDFVNAKRIQHSARSLWVGIKMARSNRKFGTAATYALLLKNLFPESKEYQAYKESSE